MTIQRKNGGRTCPGLRKPVQYQFGKLDSVGTQSATNKEEAKVGSRTESN